jgi:hypothetical protein
MRLAVRFDRLRFAVRRPATLRGFAAAFLAGVFRLAFFFARLALAFVFVLFFVTFFLVFFFVIFFFDLAGDLRLAVRLPAAVFFTDFLRPPAFSGDRFAADFFATFFLVGIRNTLRDLYKTRNYTYTKRKLKG